MKNYIFYKDRTSNSEGMSDNILKERDYQTKNGTFKCSFHEITFLHAQSQHHFGDRVPALWYLQFPISDALIYTILGLTFSISMCGDFPSQSRLGVYWELGPMSIEVKNMWDFAFNVKYSLTTYLY